MNTSAFSVYAVVHKNTGSQNFLVFDANRKWVKDTLDAQPYDFGSKSSAKNFIASLTVFDLERPIKKIDRVEIRIETSWDGMMINQKTLYVPEKED